MKTKLPLGIATALLSLATLISQTSTALAQGTAFTYQGRLMDNGLLANTNYDFQYLVFDAPNAGIQQGITLLRAGVAVSNGLFTTTLDFGAGIFDGSSRWLEMRVSPANQAAFTTLSPRQELTPTPYAMYAPGAGTAATATSVPWVALTGVPAGLADGVDNDTLYSAGTGLSLGGTIFSLDTAFTDARYDARYWKLTGNAGTTPGVHFLGTTDNQALELKVNGGRALRLEPHGTSPNVLGGHSGNFVGAGIFGAAIGGGGAINRTNAIFASYATIGGGYDNAIGINSTYSVISGGSGNQIATYSVYAAIVGGRDNGVGTNADYSVVGGGYANEVADNSFYATIAGGYANDIGANADSSAIGGGRANGIEAQYGTIAGGWANSTRTNSDYSAIGGGYDNDIADNSAGATIPGGYSNHVGTNSDYSVIGGGYDNDIGMNASYGAISGGDNNAIADNSGFATIAGGWANNTGTNSDYSAIGGGYDNDIAGNSPGATIAGGRANDIGINCFYSLIGGGTNNNISTNSDTSTIAGGENNNIGTYSHSSAIGGGRYNWIGNYSYSPTVAGGAGNNIGSVCDESAIGGGLANGIGDLSLGATIGGGYSNNIAVDSRFATIPGGVFNTATDYAFAAGRQAKANHTGAFVWADSSAFNFPSTANNQFNVRATGGVRIVTGIDGTGAPDAGVSLNADDASWNVISDRNAKKNFRPVDVREILERLAQVPVQRWNYKWEPDGAVLHIGPTAQDFKAAFYPGRDDKTISTLEADGVALAAIQGLNQKLEETRAENATLRRELGELKQLVNSLRRQFAGTQGGAQ